MSKSVAALAESGSEEPVVTSAEAGVDDPVRADPSVEPTTAADPEAALTVLFGEDDADDAPSEPAEAPVAEQPRPRKPKARASLLETLTPFVLWLSLLLVLGSLGYAAWIGGVDQTVALLFGGGLLAFGTLMLLASASRAYSPLLLSGLMFRGRGRGPQRRAVLAGQDILTALGLAEKILSADPEARLVTTRDGVVVYANEAYMRIAEEAGVVGATGLPPRIERLFGQAGGESTKMFRLARAARSGAEGDEVITQAMGRIAPGDADLPRRRFEVAVRPMGSDGRHVAWRLREVPVENARDDLRAAFANYPRAVFALERSGNLAWTNAAAARMIGLRPGATVALSDFVLGETSELVSTLWDAAGEEVEARIRDRDAKNGPGHAGVVLTAFARGGIGEGFACVEMLPKGGLVREAGAQELSSDVAEAPIGVAVLEGDPGADARITYSNRLMTDALGAEDGASVATVLPQTALRDIAAALKARAPSQPLTRRIELSMGKGAQARLFEVYARPIKRRRGAYGPRQTVLYAIDVTAQRRLQEDATHDAKLKQVGQLAGAIAHDFNNLLLVVMGSTELLMRRHSAGDPSYPDLVLIKENAQRARNLTRNLLAFSRKQTLQQEVLSLTEVLSEFTPFLARYVTERVKVDVRHGRALPAVKADKGQLELALMNLAVNARDAMPKGGNLTIETKTVRPDEVRGYGYAVLEEIAYVLIEVADDGTGVPEDIAEKIFEPFFTTKGEGKGTGLGLSTVHGIIGQMGGRIFLHNRTAPGAPTGATFRIFLPALGEEEARQAQGARAHQPNENADLTGKGRILIVEDDPGVRSIVVRALGMCGYEIVEAEDGDEALGIIEDEKPFDLVLTDIMMPEMDGPTLIAEAGEKLRGAKVIFMSGYAETAMRDKLSETQGAGYLQKPFTLKKVAATVKEALSG
ncbi:response regulator [Parvularcula dongshanensis]|uniref:histidine kinase n=1 Tax=Parvularcula dongshanensis TaxID=1173995 RepID=A0A840I3B8_9PROT|nr:response regulator [Parvularcula dongshanensis]MBB4658678.1 two-component system cell cycle sensor histidine kinase/response regulator CckA [Parvularcula dongshanensis]